MTLTETLLTLTIIGISVTLAVPRVRHGLDSMKVRAAREAAFGIATQTRTVALARTGADFVVDINAENASIVDAAGVTVATTNLAQYDVDILATGSPGLVTLHYDSHGIGRMAGQTLRFRRGSAEAGLTFSAYGRVRRW